SRLRREYFAIAEFSGFAFGIKSAAWFLLHRETNTAPIAQDRRTQGRADQRRIPHAHRASLGARTLSEHDLDDPECQLQDVWSISIRYHPNAESSAAADVGAREAHRIRGRKKSRLVRSQ